MNGNEDLWPGAGNLAVTGGSTAAIIFNKLAAAHQLSPIWGLSAAGPALSATKLVAFATGKLLDLRCHVPTAPKRSGRQGIYSCVWPAGIVPKRMVLFQALLFLYEKNAL